MDDIQTVINWRRQASWGDRSVVAKHLGVHPQYVTNAVSDARRGLRTVRVSRVAEAIRAISGQREIVLDLDRILEACPPPPTRLDRLTSEVVLTTGLPYPVVEQYIRSRFGVMTNVFNDAEFVFARLAGRVENE